MQKAHYALVQQRTIGIAYCTYHFVHIFSWQYASVIAKGGEPPVEINVFANVFFAWGSAGIINHFSYKFRLNRKKPFQTYILGALILVTGAALAALPLFGKDFWINFISLIAWIPVNVGISILFVGLDLVKLDLEKNIDDNKLKKYIK